MVDGLHGLRNKKIFLHLAFKAKKDILVTQEAYKYELYRILLSEQNDRTKSYSSCGRPESCLVALIFILHF